MHAAEAHICDELILRTLNKPTMCGILGQVGRLTPYSKLCSRISRHAGQTLEAECAFLRLLWLC